jgi:hypothetical protein
MLETFEIDSCFRLVTRRVLFRFREIFNAIVEVEVGGLLFNLQTLVEHYIRPMWLSFASPS